MIEINDEDGDTNEDVSQRTSEQPLAKSSSMGVSTLKGEIRRDKKKLGVQGRVKSPEEIDQEIREVKLHPIFMHDEINA